MKEKREPVLLLCDQEEEYASQMTEFMRMHKELPWRIRTYTDADKMLEEESGRAIDVLVVAERTYQEQMTMLHPLRTVILVENGLDIHREYIGISKYQEAQKVLQAFLEVYLEIADGGYFRVAEAEKTIFIGIYSPIRRSFQTTFALTLSQLLAERHRTLYLNFEHFCGISELAAQTDARDLADLLYFLMAEKDKFQLRLQTIAQHRGNLDYVPPMKSGQNLLSVTAEEWQNLLGRISETGAYEYVIMDLSESMQGLFDVLRQCKVVYTLTKEDKVAQGKLAEYERILGAYEYEDILPKTRKCRMPQVRKVPDTIDHYTKSEWADMVHNLMKELEETKENGLH